MKALRFVPVTAMVLFSLVVGSATWGQGVLDPPSGAFQNGVPFPSMRSLDQVEPRIPIDSIPYVIEESGSYFVTGNLRTSERTNGISIFASDVNLDLGGFALIGEVGTASGIAIQRPCQNISIRNGVLREWGAHGLWGFKAYESRVHGINASSNGWSGITVSWNSVVEDCISRGNQGDGINVGEGSSVVNCNVSHNVGYGIYIYSSGKVLECTARKNENTGIYAYEYCTIRNCTAVRNKVDGIGVWKRCRVSDNDCGENGFEAGGAGIHAWSGGSRIQGNTVTGNDYGVKTDAAGNIVIHNSATGNPVGNYVLDESTVFGSLRQGVGEVLLFSPWANFAW